MVESQGFRDAQRKRKEFSTGVLVLASLNFGIKIGEMAEHGMNIKQHIVRLIVPAAMIVLLGVLVLL